MLKVTNVFYKERWCPQIWNLKNEKRKIDYDHLKKKRILVPYKQGNMDIENPIFKTVMLFKNKTQPVKCLYL